MKNRAQDARRPVPTRNKDPNDGRERAAAQAPQSRGVTTGDPPSIALTQADAGKNLPQLVGQKGAPDHLACRTFCLVSRIDSVGLGLQINPYNLRGT